MTLNRGRYSEVWTVILAIPAPVHLRRLERLISGLHIILKHTFILHVFIIDFFPLFSTSRHHLSKQPPDSIHSQWGEWDLGPGGRPLPWRFARQQGRPGAPHRAVDCYAQLRLRGLRAGSVHWWTQQGHPADRPVPEHDGHQVVVQQGVGQTVRQQPVQEQRGVQGGLEPIRLRLHWNGLLG